ncbi:MAG: hypothetical protein CFE39_12630 [Comamonadaceae bacterium PBBC2]|nr:MAG: hypothetical protein CFE39_12630 [Comamonadaceae bacterium PBBC2]
MTETRRARITRALQDIDTWRASGMKLKAYAQSRSEELSHWRAQLSWERRWRQALDPAPNTAPPNTAFVRAVPIKHAKHVNAMPTQDACVRIVLGQEPHISLNDQQWQALTVGLPWRKLGPDRGIVLT